MKPTPRAPLKPHEVIHRPISTEKTHEAMEALQTYVFEVEQRASKTEIKQAVESLWNVRVISVRTSHVPTKPKRVGRKRGHTRAWKKAVVRLAGDQAIQDLR